ncbi:MAG: D-glycerate dehydrogenase, partial [Anaerolineales bacterium]
RGFGMRILFHDDQVSNAVGEELGAEKVAFEHLLSESDFVSLHVPLTEATKHLIGARELQLMKDSAVLINTSRGPVVDLEALYGALTRGEIDGAALDVTDPEPISDKDPLLSLSNCLIVPHMASSSVATRSKMAIMAAENLKAGLSGERIPYCANPEVYKDG